MTTLSFCDTQVVFSKTKTWPKSPDRDLCDAGSESYNDSQIQEIFTNDYDMEVTSGYFDDILEDSHPVKIANTIVYKKDPLVQIMKRLYEIKGIYSDINFHHVHWVDPNGLKIKSTRAKYIKEKPVIYHNGLNFTDKVQAQLSNCGFVSTITCLSLHAQAHNILFSSIYPPVYNPTGIYSVRIIVEDKIYYLLIDDYFPVENYSYTSNETLWYFIIEKAFAKLSGGFHNLGGGLEKYMGVNSSSNISINDENMDKLWKTEFIDYFKKHGVTYQGTGGKNDYLVSGHVYAIIDAAEWGKNRLVRLHNPWNKAEYTGPFSPNSSDWDFIPKDIQESVFHTQAFNGKTFWMPYEIYAKELPKISTMTVTENINKSLKSILHGGSIQDERVLTYFNDDKEKQNIIRQWSKYQIYTAGDKVHWRGLSWIAEYWHVNVEPGVPDIRNCYKQAWKRLMVS